VTSRLIRIISTATSFPWLAVQAVRATNRARSLDGPGLAFAHFGRRHGSLGALRAGAHMQALDLLLTPVSIVRYWEFPFVWRHLHASPGQCLDVASPRLFSCYVGLRSTPLGIQIINPDVHDSKATLALALGLGLRSIRARAEPVASLRGLRDAFDSIWSISVVEHIADDGDVDAIEILWAALRPGGRLLITVPVDRRPWDEYRSADAYGLGTATVDGRYFFQRWYDEAAVQRRLVKPAAGARVTQEWFGEKRPGQFDAYEQAWIQRGHSMTVEDPLLIARDWQQYPNWASMPGRGVVGICLEKPS
jgi:SAM-dependent methyltransferase